MSGRLSGSTVSRPIVGCTFAVRDKESEDREEGYLEGEYSRPHTVKQEVLSSMVTHNLVGEQSFHPKGKQASTSR